VNLCSEDHEEVCFEGNACPVCDMRDDMQVEIDKLTTANKTLDSECENLQVKLNESEE